VGFLRGGEGLGRGSYRDTGIQDTGIQDTGIQGNEYTGIQGYRIAKIYKYRVHFSEIQILIPTKFNADIQGYQRN